MTQEGKTLASVGQTKDHHRPGHLEPQPEPRPERRLYARAGGPKPGNHPPGDAQQKQTELVAGSVPKRATLAIGKKYLAKLILRGSAQKPREGFTRLTSRQKIGHDSTTSKLHERARVQQVAEDTRSLKANSVFYSGAHFCENDPLRGSAWSALRFARHAE